MTINKIPLKEKLVYQLYELACTPFQLSSYQERWNDFGWTYKSDIGDEDEFQVKIQNGWVLNVDLLGKEIIGAHLPFYYWEEYDPDFHEDLKEYRRQRQTYNKEFEATRNFVQQLLPPPIQFWTDADKDAHMAVIWEGDYGLLILQQACFDPQFGIELDFWLTGCLKIDFQPTSPLIDWLCKYSHDLHAKKDCF